MVTNFLQQALGDPTLNEVFLLSTFKLQPKSTATIFGLYSSTGNSKYFEFTVVGRMNKGELFGVSRVKLVWDPWLLLPHRGTLKIARLTFVLESFLLRVVST